MKLDDVIQQPGMLERMQQQTVISRINVCLPGKVTKYNSGKRCVDVLPLVRESDTSGMPPILQDVPVWFPGDFYYNVNVGDECLVFFADRSIDQWWQTGDLSNPISSRKHDLSDGFAFVGIRSLPNSSGGKNLDVFQEITPEDAGKVLGVDEDGLVVPIEGGGGSTALYRQFWRSTTSMSLQLEQGKVFVLKCSGSTAGTTGAIMDSVYGCLIHVIDGDYAIVHKGTGITVSVSNGTMTVSSSAAIAMSIAEL